MFVNSNLYANIASADALQLMQKKEVVIIDVRSRSEFNSKDSAFNRNLGHIKNALNFPPGDFLKMFNKLNMPKEKSIVLYDLDGSASADIAADLSKMGYSHVYNLFEGLEGLLCDNYLSPAMIKTILADPPPFHVVSAKECIDLLSKPNNFLIIDARPKVEFDNKSPEDYLNNGHIKNAINVPSVDALNTVIDKADKNADILVYGSYSSNGDVDICKALIEKGYINVFYLYQNIVHFTWACFNIQNCKDGINILADHEGLY